jgi:large subunit ribosomal protein L25
VSEVLTVESREGRGTAFSHRLRAEGKIPAVLYGQGKESISISICAKSLGKLLRKGKGKEVLQLEGSLNESATIKDLQYDAFGSNLLHVDLIRVNAGE